MNDTADVKSSSLPVSAILFVIFIILSLVLNLVISSTGVFAQLRVAVIIGWAAKLLFDLVRWLRSNKDTRPRMKFPRKTAGVLLVIILAVGYFGYLIAVDMGDR